MPETALAQTMALDERKVAMIMLPEVVWVPPVQATRAPDGGGYFLPELGQPARAELEKRLRARARLRSFLN
jgi:hypothetical protein